MTDVRPLAAVAAAVSGLAAGGVLPTGAGLPHHVALPPLDLFADVRVLLAEAPSYPLFVGGLVLALAARSVVMAAMCGALHVDGVARALAFYGVALVPALAAGALGFTGVAAAYSLFIWIGVAVALVVAVVMGPMPWRGRPPRRWYRRGARVVIAGYLAPLLVVSLGSALGSGPVRVLLVWVSAALTALVVRWLPGRRERHARPAAVVALVLLLVALPLPAETVPAAAPAQGATGTLFLVPGNGGASGTSSIFRFDPAALGFDCERTAYFSYAGPGQGAPQRRAECPITTGAPYRPRDTGRPLGELAASFRAQLAELTPPVVVVAHSQGAWIATAGLDRTAAPSVDALVLLGAFPRHTGGYVLDGTGAGVVGTDALEGLIAGLRSAGATSFDPRSPLARQLLGTRGAIDRVMTAGYPRGLRVATVTSAYDLPVTGRDWQLGGATDLCPVYVAHGDLPASAPVLRRVRAFLDGGDGGPCGWWRRWPTQAFTAFGVRSP